MTQEKPFWAEKVREKLSTHDFRRLLKSRLRSPWGNTAVKRLRKRERCYVYVACFQAVKTK